MVVKAGISETARFLIAKENLFLRSAPTNTPGFPRIGESFESEHIRALSLDYTSGQPPRSTDDAPMFLLATAWLDESKTMPLHETLSWQRLKSATASPFFSKLEKRIADRRFHPSIYHGDFAPWNIKSKENSWTVLDWERGELIGIPGWDCFHFLIQPAILVTRTRTELLAAQVERFLQREDFQNYAKRAHITGSERELLLSYLLHQIDVIKPTEGMAATQNLFAALCSKWLAAD